MPHGINSPLTLDSQGAPAAAGTVEQGEPMTWIAFWIWQDPGLPNRGRAAATGRATYVPPMTTTWSAATRLVEGSPPFTAGRARAMALALVTAGGANEFYWWQKNNVQIV